MTMVDYELGWKLRHPNDWTDQPTLNGSLLSDAGAWVKNNGASQHDVCFSVCRAGCHSQRVLVAGTSIYNMLRHGFGNRASASRNRPSIFLEPLLFSMWFFE